MKEINIDTTIIDWEKDYYNVTMALMKHGYEMSIYREETLIIIRFDYHDPQLCDKIVTWVTPEQYEKLFLKRVWKIDKI